MKRNCFLLLLWLNAACIQEKPSEFQVETGNFPESVKSEFYAKGDSDTKTLIQTDARGGNHVWWTAGDAIRIYDDVYSPGYVFNIVGDIEYGAPSATFVGYESKDATVFYAAYPSIGGSSCTEGVFEGLKIPSRQTAVFRSFDKSAFVCVTKADARRNLHFENVCALFRIEVNTPAIREVRITDPDGAAALAGTFSCTYTDKGEVVLGDVANSSSELTLLPPDGRKYFATGVYYISTLPDYFTAVKLTYVDDETGSTVEESVQGSLPLDMKSGMVVNLGALKESCLLDKSDWALIYCNSELQQDFGQKHSYVGFDGDKYTGSANDLIDSDPKSLWNYNFHQNKSAYDTKASDMADNVPYYVVIDLGSVKNIASIELTARQPREHMIEYNQTYINPVGRLDVEFSNDIIRRGMADILDNGESDWKDKESFREDRLLNQKVNKVNFARTHSCRYVRLTIMESYVNSEELTPSYTGAVIAELDLYDSVGNKMDKTNWKIIYVKSEVCEDYSARGFVDSNTGSTYTGFAEKMIDGDYISFWGYSYSPATLATPSVRQFPYYFVIDFGAQIQLNAFRLTNMAQYDSMYAENYSTWERGPAQVTFEFANSITGRGVNDIFDPSVYSNEFNVHTQTFDLTNQKSNELSFSKTISARYVRMKVTKAFKDNVEQTPTRAFGCEIAELDFLLK